MEVVDAALQPVIPGVAADSAPLPSASLLAAVAALAARRHEVSAGGSIGLDLDSASVQQRGRSRERHPSPRSARRLSRELLTPPTSPSSPTSVLPSSVDSRKVADLQLEELSEAARTICSPTSLLRPLQLSATPTRPPGFEAEPATPSLQRPVTPPSPPGFESSRRAAPSPQSPAADALFVQAQPAILPDPVITPRPAPPANRRKTLALGFTARCTSMRIKAAHHGAPIAKLAQRNLLRKLTGTTSHRRQ
jgi:hypothetical protein